MYRDDPLDDEAELRDLVGDAAIDGLRAAEERLGRDDLVTTAVDALLLLRGWASEEEVASWFRTDARRLDARSPVTALADGDVDEVIDVARAWAASRG